MKQWADPGRMPGSTGRQALWLLLLFAVFAAAGLRSPDPVRASVTPTAMITAGEAHTCWLLETGGVKCWGRNQYGQLGDGSTTSSNVPVDVSGLTSGVKEVAAGFNHTCAVLLTGAVKCWGWNYGGQLGDGTTTGSAVPVSVAGLGSGVAHISAGYQHTCAITDGGGLKCWGANGNGQLGNGTNTASLAPVDVSGLTSGVRQVSAGVFHTCAATDLGSAKCWGWNGHGELGDGSSTDSNAPVAVQGLASGVEQVSAGKYWSCAVVSGGAKCWGLDTVGQLGDGGTTNSSVTVYSSVPVDVLGMSSETAQLSAGETAHTCGLLVTGAVKCWGWNYSGGLGDGSTNHSSSPVAVSGLSARVVQVTTGSLHSCALMDSGAVKCWGSNVEGQLGDGTNTERHTPVLISGYVDEGPPDTTITLDPAAPNGNNGWYTSDVLASVAATDDSAITETRCVLDPATPPATFDDLPASCGFLSPGAAVSSEGAHTLYAASVDGLGNKETPVSASFKIDKTAPEFWVGYDSENGTIEVGGSDANGIADVVMTGALFRTYTVEDGAGNTTELRMLVLQLGFGRVYFALKTVDYGDGEQPIRGGGLYYASRFSHGALKSFLSHLRGSEGPAVMAGYNGTSTVVLGDGAPQTIPGFVTPVLVGAAGETTAVIAP